MFIFVLPLSLFLFATSKSGMPEKQLFVSVGSMYCVHVKKLSDSLQSLGLCSRRDDKEKGRGRNVQLKIM